MPLLKKIKDYNRKSPKTAINFTHLTRQISFSVKAGAWAQHGAIVSQLTDWLMICHEPGVAFAGFGCRLAKYGRPMESGVSKQEFNLGLMKSYLEFLPLIS